MSRFFSFMDGSRQRNDASRGFQDSQRTLDSGRTAANTAITSGRDNAINYLQPYMQSGQRGQTAYEDTLGLNGQAARQRAFQTGYLDDPALAYRNQNNMQQMNSLYRKYNAGPQGINSGAAMLGAGRLASEQFDRDWGGYQNRLMNLGQQGQQAAGNAAQITYGAGRDIAGNEMSYANTSAGNRINYANAQAQSRGVGMNNLLSIAGTAARFIPGSRGGGGGAQTASDYGAGDLGGTYWS